MVEGVLPDVPCHRRRRIPRRGLGIACWVAVAIAAVFGVSRYFAFSSTAAVSAVALTPWSLIPAGLAVGGLVALGGRRQAALAALLVALVSWPQAVLYLPDGRATSAPAVTVMTVNTRHGGADPDALVATVRERGVDVLSVQKLAADFIADLTASGLDRVLPYRSIAVQPGGTDV